MRAMTTVDAEKVRSSSQAQSPSHAPIISRYHENPPPLVSTEAMDHSSRHSHSCR